MRDYNARVRGLPLSIRWLELVILVKSVSNSHYYRKAYLETTSPMCLAVCLICVLSQADHVAPKTGGNMHRLKLARVALFREFSETQLARAMQWWTRC